MQIDNVTERQLKFGVLKLAITLTFGLLLVAAIVSFFIDAAYPLARIPITALIIAVAVMILANGCLAILQILDWFERRRTKQEVENG